MRQRAVLAVLTLVLACSDDEATVAIQTPADASTTLADAAVPVTNDAAITDASVENKAIPLLDWVDDLVDHHTDEVSAPDTVDDKHIVDDENPTAYDSRF
jgi:hypothetical protein